MKAFAVALVALMLGACSTVPQSLPVFTGPAVIILRDTGFVGGGCDAVIFVNGKRTGMLPQGKQLVLPVPTGLHKVRAALGDEAGSGICPNLTMTQLVEVGTAPAYLRLGFAGGGSGQMIFETVER